MARSIAILIALVLSSCISSGSRYSYSERTDTYHVSAKAQIYNNSESVDLEVYVLQQGEIVKYITFGKLATDNRPAIEAQANSIQAATATAQETLSLLERLRSGFMTP